MRRWEQIGTGDVPGGGGQMTLYQRGTELSIHVRGRELMHSGLHGSEDALANLVCDRLGSASGLRILVGGLGMGYTLAAALRRVGPDGQVTVAELVPVVIEWNRGPLAHLAGHPLDDPRSRVFAGDVRLAISGEGPWDAIALDVDNGPEGLTRSSNDALYGPEGLSSTYAALRPGGWLSVWSATPAPAFTRALQRAGFRVEVVTVPARQDGGGGARHTIWLAQRPPTASVRPASTTGARAGDVTGAAAAPRAARPVRSGGVTTKRGG